MACWSLDLALARRHFDPWFGFCTRFNSLCCILELNHATWLACSALREKDEKVCVVVFVDVHSLLSSFSLYYVISVFIFLLLSLFYFFCRCLVVASRWSCCLLLLIPSILNDDNLPRACCQEIPQTITNLVITGPLWPVRFFFLSWFMISCDDLQLQGFILCLDRCI